MAAPSRKDDDAEVFIYDRRTTAAPEVKLSIAGIASFSEFKEKVKGILGEGSDDFVIATTSRDEIKNDETWDYVENGDTLYILKDIKQELCAPAQERVDYLPHYDTIVKGGMYEYYASEGQNPLPYAFAELIDNSLAATALNDGPRRIELRLFIDDASLGKNCIVVIDNGTGMTPRQLNSWAIYRLSKFTRREKRGKRGETDLLVKSADTPLSLADTWAPRFMNSDISYFGVGGKQAVFFIGNATRMISKPKDSKDVHELAISKEDFEKKEKNHQSIYTGYIRNRQPGDSSHILPEDEHVIKLISEEPGRENFTAVVIQGINLQHLTYLKQHFNMWTRQLAHIYHFYLHGPDGNKLREDETIPPESSAFNNINIQVTMHVRGNPNPKTIDLRKIDDDMQSQYVRTSASTFEFKAYVDGSTAVEGIVRYHPFRYDKETYPADIYGARLEPEPEDDHGYAINERPARGRRPIFEAYWNGRLIPYTLIEEFEWCSLPKKQKSIPAECYNRISGVLWTNDSFQVSTNKLTFLDLELKLKDKNTNFVRIMNGHEKRTQIEREFQAWLKECNEEYDKQILFSANQGQVTRTDQPKHKQTPWTKFNKVEWDNRVYEVGQMVRILRTSPALHGTIQAFYLYGEHEGDVFSMGGDIELLQEPQSLYTERRYVPLNKLDRGASALQIKKYMEEEEAKLPDHLVVSWPNGLELVPNEKRHAGKTIGDIKVEICNKRGEKISKIPFSSVGSKKLLVELKLIWHSPHGDETIVSLLSQHGKTWPYWFRKMDSAKNLGNYTLQLYAVLNESGNNMFGGRELPSHKIKFSVNEADAEKFTVGILDGPFKMGVPFQIPLEFQDRYNNSSRPPAKLKPILDADGLELSYENTQVKGNSCFIKGVVAKGIVNTNAGKNFNLKVSIPGLDQSQTLKIRLLPGPPSELIVKPETEVSIENGTAPSFFVEVHDAAGNITSGGKLTVFGRLTGVVGLPSLLADLSVTGSGTLTGKPVEIKNMNGEKIVIATIEIQGARNVKPVERVIRVTPSNRVSILRVFYDNEGSDVEIKNSDSIERTAGSIIEGLRFEVLNEAGEALVIDDKLAGKIKVNWAPKVPKDMALKKVLPPIKVSTSVLEQKYCQASVMEGEGIELQFSIKPTPCPPSQMECHLIGDGKTMLGEPMKSVINISLKDVHGNLTPIPDSFKNELSYTCPALKIDQINVVATNHQVQVNNLIFTEMGTKEVEMKWKELKGYVRCEVLSGPPAGLQVLDWLTEEAVVVHNNKPLPHPLRVQLVDSEGNACEVSDIKIHIAYSRLKIQPSPSYVKTDSSGIADFGILTVQAGCGSYELQPKAAIGRSVINGPKLIIDIQPDSHRPVEIDVSYNTKHSILTGHTLPDFTVTVRSESGNLLPTTNPDHLSMKLWKKESSSENIPPPKAQTVRPQNGTKDEAGTFNFRKCQAPCAAGDYSIMFVYFDGAYELYSLVSTITVNPGPPTSLVPIDHLTTPTVSNTKSVASRTLIKSLRLELRDEFDNPVGKGYNGKVKVQISSHIKAEEIPLFANGSNSTEFNLQNGQCVLQNLTLQESTSGKDGFEYLLSCTVTCDMIPKNKPLAPLEISFLFYNDAKKQQQMATLSKERDALQNTIRAYKSMFETQQQLISELRAAVHESQKEEQALRGELRKQNIPSNHLQSVDTVDKLIAARIKDRDQVLRTPRRSCALPPVEADPEVLGKIAHLALIHQDDISRVLSWHMSADMDCVVTLTTQKAKEVYQKTQGKQQVLPLDSIYRKNLPDWEKPLPHMRFRPNYKPVGNPVYARNLLEFTKDEESCRVVFGMLLGDTLILDNLDQANLYRQEIVKYTHCPTILTRSGDRIRSNGKFGGAMNKAPPVDKLKGCIFGQPLPMAYHAICTQIDTLEKYKAALIASIQAQDELQEQINIQKLPETLHKFKECKEAETRLKGVEHKLGMGISARGSKHATASIPDSEPVLKKIKTEPGTTPVQSNQTPSVTPSTKSKSTIPDPTATPSRTSLRIASMTTVVSEDGRKRLKKST